MEFKSEQKHILLSPRKVRPVADVIRKMSPKKAIEVLPFVKKRASEPLAKVIKAAAAAAAEKGIDLDNLKFKEIQIGEGPRLKRGRPVSRGRWHPIKKRMSHVRVVLESVEKAKKTVKKSTPAKPVRGKEKVLKKGANK